MSIADDFRTITPTLFAWQAYEPAVKCDLSSVAVDTADGLVILDPIALAEPALARLLRGRKPCAIILTNGNHARAAEGFRTRLSVKILTSADDDGLGLTPDAFLSDSDTAPGGMRVVALPGAGPGEIALIGGGIACIGDALINLPPEGFRMLPEKYCEDAAELRRSLRKLLSCEFEAMTFAHGVPLTGSSRQKLETLLA